MPSLIHKLLLFSGGAAAFSPSDISGLVAWYDSSDLATLWQDSARTTPATANADVIGARDDKSGNGYHLLQTTTANKMTLRTNVLNGHPCVRADGVNDYLVKAFGTSYAQPNTMFQVFDYKSANFEFVFDGTEVANRVLLTGSSPNLILSAGTNLAYAQALPTTPIIFETLAKGASSNVTVNGVSKVTGNAGTNALVGLTLAARYTLGDNAEVDFFEELYYNRELTAQETTDIRVYLNSKWAVY